MSNVLTPFFNIQVEFVEPELLTIKDRLNAQIRERILSFEFLEEQDKYDKLTLTIDNSDLIFFDIPVIRVGNIIIVDFGYNHTDSDRVKRYGRRRFVVTQLKGSETLKLSAMQDGAFGMDREKRTRTFPISRNLVRDVFKIISDIADEYGFNRKVIKLFDFNPEIRNTQEALATDNDFLIKQFNIQTGITDLTQEAETDWQFLKKIAKKAHHFFSIQDDVFIFIAIGATIFADDPGFHLNKEIPSRLSTLRYFQSDSILNGPGDILSFTLDHNILDVPPRVEVCGINPDTKEEFVETANKEVTERVAEGSRSAVPDEGEGFSVPITLPPGPVVPSVNSFGVIPGFEFSKSRSGSSVALDKAVARKVNPKDVMPIAATSEAEAKTVADTAFKDPERNALKLKIITVGDPRVRLIERTEVIGIGEVFSGNWRTFKVKHTINSSGYITKAELDKVGFDDPIFPDLGKVKLELKKSAFFRPTKFETFAGEGRR